VCGMLKLLSKGLDDHLQRAEGQVARSALSEMRVQITEVDKHHSRP
jgi:hypothetical protein